MGDSPDGLTSAPIGGGEVKQGDFGLTFAEWHPLQMPLQDPRQRFGPQLSVNAFQQPFVLGLGVSGHILSLELLGLV